MATNTTGTETGTGTSTTPPEGTETGQQEQQGQQQTSTGETSGQEQQQSGNEKPTELPDDHPLVKKLGIQKDEIGTLKTELTEARAQAARATKLEEDLGKRPTTEALDTLQKRYDRLEAFLGQVGGPLSKALDSRTFTKDLFETDKDIKELVTTFMAANPTATSTALGAKGAAPADGKVDPNALLRAAFNGK